MIHYTNAETKRFVSESNELDCCGHIPDEIYPDMDIVYNVESEEVEFFETE